MWWRQEPHSAWYRQDDERKEQFATDVSRRAISAVTVLEHQSLWPSLAGLAGCQALTLRWPGGRRTWQGCLFQKMRIHLSPSKLGEKYNTAAILKISEISN